MKCSVCDASTEICAAVDGSLYCPECYEEWTMPCYFCGERCPIKEMKSNCCKDCNKEQEANKC